MKLKQMLQCGQYVAIAPVGLPMTLQYNAEGVLEKIFLGFDGKVDMTKDLMIPLRSNPSVIRNVSIKNGTSWVKGVLYTGKDLQGRGNVPECYEEELLDYCEENPDQFNFFAGTVESTAVHLVGAVAIRQRLQMMKFNVFPGAMITTLVSDDGVIKYLDSVSQFKYPKWSYLFVFDGSDLNIIPTGMKCHEITDIMQTVDESGNVTDHVRFDDEEYRIYSYGDVVEQNLHDGDFVYLVDGKMLKVKTGKKSKSEPFEGYYRCPVCGHKTKYMYGSMHMKCGYGYCRSTMYPTINHMMKVFHLPELPYSEYRSKFMLSKNYTALTDVFCMPQYENVEINTTLGDILDAVIPIDKVRVRSVFKQFANNCSNNILTFRHYLNNPLAIKSDLNMSGLGVDEFIEALTPEVLLYVNTLLDMPNVHISVSDVSFDGDPIFRGKTIFITGTFKHGTLSEIKGILKSYSAEVITKYNDAADCVLVGDIPENVSGIAIKKARKARKDVFDESTFFNMYDIDSDMKLKLGDR